VKVAAGGFYLSRLYQPPIKHLPPAPGMIGYQDHQQDEMKTIKILPLLCLVMS
jgi:hypothetical protein